MMKKNFTIPVIEIINFEKNDVITSSAMEDDIFSVIPYISNFVGGE
ncbi:MAG: hypothetical protein ACOX7H_09235 [Bacillota bacterium]|jgi:hypothetical protein